MDLKQKMNRFYLDMVLNELRMANDKSYQGVTYNSVLYLNIIAYKEKCTVSYIAEALHVAKSAVTLKVKELEKQGLVRKNRSSEDGRVHYLEVNEEFLEEFKAYDRVLYRVLDEIEKRYSEEEIHLFCELLDRMNKRFEEEIKNESV